jgi:hypothetical protein
MPAMNATGQVSLPESHYMGKEIGTCKWPFGHSGEAPMAKWHDG